MHLHYVYELKLFQELPGLYRKQSQIQNYYMYTYFQIIH